MNGERFRLRSFIRRLSRLDEAVANHSRERRPLFTRSNQGVVAVFVSLALVLMAASWLLSGGLSGGLVDIDAAEPLQANFQADINAAEWTELMQLPEIGETLAKRIVESREAHGPFTSHDDLDRVPGIGPKTLARIRRYLRPVD